MDASLPTPSRRDSSPGPPGEEPGISLCIITNTIDIGGAETQLLRLCTRIDPARVRITVLYYGGRGDLKQEFEATGIELIFLDRARTGRLRFVPTLTKLLRRRSFQVVHCWRGTANHYGALAAVLARCPCILTGHRDYEVYPLHTRLIDQALRPFVRRRVVNSKAIQDKHARTAWLPERHLRVLYNGLDPAEFEFTETPAEIRSSLGLDPKRPLLITIGRLDTPKRQGLFLELAQALTQRGLDLNFILVGRGPDRALLEGRVKALGLGDRVQLLGSRRDVARLLHAATLSVCTSVREGLPNVVLESMMAGTPVVTVDNGGGPELVDHSDQVVPGDDLAALIDRVASVLNDPTRLALWARRGRERALEVFTIERAAANYTDLIEEFASPSAARPQPTR